MNISIANQTKRAFLQTDAHIYLEPHPILAPYIAHYTLNIQGIKNNSDFLILIPDISGCIVITPEEHRLYMKFWGATTETVHVQNDDPPFRFFIEFKPGGSYALTGIPQNILLNKQVRLEQMLPDWQQYFEEAWVSSETMDAFVDSIESFLISNIKCKEQQAFLKQALPLMSRNQELSTICGFSTRHLNRMFHDTIGTSIKSYERLVKINKALEIIQNTTISLTEIAYQCGYYDQSHFIHDFKRVCGVTPGTYRKQMSIFYNETFKF